MQIDRWEVENTISHNGQVNVYLVKENGTGRPAVLKALITGGKTGEVQFRNFQREIAITAQLKHRNIVGYIDSGIGDKFIYCVFDYCNGGNLSETLLSMKRTLHLDEAIRMVFQVLDGLNYAHNVEIPAVADQPATHGVVHRDIKPENVLLNYNEAGHYTAKIADFGLSKAFHQADQGWTRTGDIGGSLAFISRQQIVNYKYARPEVDVWSAAAVLFYLLAGVPPRGAKSISFSDILKTSPRSLRIFREDLPEAAVTLIDQALDDSGSLRYKSAAELKTALQTLL